VTTTIVLPISRPDHLQPLFAALERLDCDCGQTNLLAYVDGDQELFVRARNFVEQSKFDGRLCVQGQIPGERRRFSVNVRRRRIPAVHNEIRRILRPCDYVFLIEDDSIPPAHALATLHRDYLARPYAGFITGIQVGRWGVNHLGLWRADDVYDTTHIESLMPRTGVVEVDGAGLYGCLMKWADYSKHEFKSSEAALGPDYGLGLALRRTGRKNYADFGVWIEHRKPNGQPVSRDDLVSMSFHLKDGNWVGQAIQSN
jgi:hypothetical protein